MFQLAVRFLRSLRHDGSVRSEFLTVVAFVPICVGAFALWYSHAWAAQPNSLAAWTTAAPLDLALALLSAVPLAVYGPVVFGSVLRAMRLNSYTRAHFRDVLTAFSSALSQATSPSTAEFAHRTLKSVVPLYCGLDPPKAARDPDAAGNDIKALFRAIAQRVLGGRASALDVNAFCDAISLKRRGLLARWDDQYDRPAFALNAPVGLCFDLEWGGSPSRFSSDMSFVPADYATLIALLMHIEALAEGAATLNAPWVLGAGGLLVHPDKDEILLLRRSPGNDTQPMKLHVYGGNFEPNLGIAGQTCDRTLHATAVREVLEEANAAVNVDAALAVLHREEIDANAVPIQEGWKRHMRYAPLHFLGIVVSAAEYERLNGSVEGSIYRIAIRDLESELRDVARWVPAGWVTVMLWLFLGTPCQGGGRMKSKAQAKQLFDRVLHDRHRRRFEKLLTWFGHRS